MFDFEHTPVEDQTGKQIPIDGSSDDHPIQLGGHAVPATLRDEELESICKILYDMPGVSLSQLETDEIITLFYVTNKFQFDAIYQTTVEYLDTAPVPPWKRHSLATISRNETWLLRSCIDICSLADYPPPELFVGCSNIGVQENIFALLKIREAYRTNLMTYTYDNRICPTSLDLETTGRHSCSSCRKVMKNLLRQILTGTDLTYLGDADPTTLLLLRDRLIRGIQPGGHQLFNICDPCRAKEEHIVTQVLGPTDLARMIREVGCLVSL